MLSNYIEKYRRELKDYVIPFWVKNSPDWEHGGTYTCLDRDGSVYDTKKYIWLQGRSVWMFCRLYNTFEKDPKFLEIAELGLKNIEKNAVDPKGRYYFSLTQEGKPYFYQRKPYGAVFCMLAYLEYFNATGKAEYKQKAVDLFWNIKKWIEDPSLMDRPILAGIPKASGLADVMVLASMAIELAHVDDDPAYKAVIAEALEKVQRHYDPQRRILREIVSLDGKDLSSWPEGRFFNPGHSIEVAWFILHLLRFKPDPKIEQMAFDVMEGSLELGWDKEFGGIFYFMDLENKPTLQLESSMKLWWPHTEAIYALELAYLMTKDQKWLSWLQRVDEYTFSHFVDHEYGEWFGYLDRYGKRTHTSKGGSYKGFFHVPRMLLMCVQEYENFNK